VAGDEDDRQLPICSRERLLQFETVESGRSPIQEIQENAAGSIEVAPFEEVFCRGESLALVAGAAQQAGKSPPCGWVVIDYEHSWSLLPHLKK
jgi:hypothetical protein